MFERDIYTIHSTYREDMRIRGFQFGKGEKSACIVGAARGNEIQQMYICSQLVKTLRELENNGCISAGKQILVIPTINAYSVNISRRFSVSRKRISIGVFREMITGSRRTV